MICSKQLLTSSSSVPRDQFRLFDPTMIRQLTTLVLSLALAQAATATRKMCSDEDDYIFNFNNLLTPARFGDSIQKMGLVFSPLAGASNSNRVFLLAVKGLASPRVEQIAETGQNYCFLLSPRVLLEMV
eukprot:gb/GEZJ01008815.1/.p2 GENE.gb/GEZJ01008815.1/~~gb/GEZJ01008815.1/.p2  ORF type:complete len:129 (-),score=9.10 gb/GEZJ01008815.1/:688-1074(-)